MEFEVHVTVHVYAEERLDDKVLIPHSKRYGILGKDFIGPLRKINGRIIKVSSDNSDYSVADLWDYLYYRIFGNSGCERVDLMTFMHTDAYIEKYLLFNGFRYSITKLEQPLLWCLRRMGINQNGIVEVELLANSDAGTVYEDDGIRYSFHSREAGKHSEAHVHVDIKDEESGSFSLIDGRQLTKKPIKRKYVNKIQSVISENREAFLKYWNEHTDGLIVDLNQALGIIKY